MLKTAASARAKVWAGRLNALRGRLKQLEDTSFEAAASLSGNQGSNRLARQGSRQEQRLAVASGHSVPLRADALDRYVELAASALSRFPAHLALSKCPRSAVRGPGIVEIGPGPSI